MFTGEKFCVGKIVAAEYAEEDHPDDKHPKRGPLYELRPAFSNAVDFLQGKPQHGENPAGKTHQHEDRTGGLQHLVGHCFTPKLSLEHTNACSYII